MDENKNIARVAVKNNDLPGLRKVLHSGMDVKSKYERDQTLLHLAMCTFSYDKYRERIIITLLDEGANIDALDVYKRTPLHIASMFGAVGGVKFLLEHGSNLHLKDNDGKTSLYLASEFGYIEIIQMLLDHGANINNKDANGKTPIVTYRTKAFLDDYFAIQVKEPEES